MSDQFKIPALDRGLTVLEHFVITGRDQRYSDVKRLFPGITDATLNRLLKALMASGYLEKNGSGHYCVTDKLRRWGGMLDKAIPFEKLLAAAVIELSSATRVSSSFARKVGDHLEFAFTTNIPDSINLAPMGTLLCFESDHAASLAVISNMSEAERLVAFASSYSNIKSKDAYSVDYDKFSQDGYFIDVSRSRPGISRMAVYIDHPLVCGALFIGSTTEHLLTNEKGFSKAMIKCTENFIKRLNEG